MIKLWKDENRNKELRDILAKEKLVKHGFWWRYEPLDMKISYIMEKYKCTKTMAKKSYVDYIW